MEAYTVTHVNRQPMGISCLTQELKMGLCNNLEGWNWVGGEREGTYAHLWLFMLGV